MVTTYKPVPEHLRKRKRGPRWIPMVGESLTTGEIVMDNTKPVKPQAVRDLEEWLDDPNASAASSYTSEGTS